MKAKPKAYFNTKRSNLSTEQQTLIQYLNISCQRLEASHGISLPAIKLITLIHGCNIFCKINCINNI